MLCQVYLQKIHILPTNTAPIIEKTEHGLQLSLCKWGFPLQKGKNLVINARAETVLDKPSFSNGIWYHRIVIPASGFYEWNRLREKNTFTRSNASVLYLAGFCDWFDNERRFVILTTAANESMIKVHDRMPLILEKEQMEDWFDNEKMQVILQILFIFLLLIFLRQKNNIHINYIFTPRLCQPFIIKKRKLSNG